jgi:fructokinase
MLLRKEELDRELLAGTRAFHFGSISLIQEPSRSATLEALGIARQAGVLVSFDVNYRPSLWNSRKEAYERIVAAIPYVDLLKLNEGELELLTGSKDLATAESLLHDGPKLCVVTLGREGSFFRIADGGEHVPAFRVATVDATGCGDGFVAGLLCQLVCSGQQERLSLARMREVLRYANAVGALTSLTQGVIPALPTARQVQAFLAQQS